MNSTSIAAEKERAAAGEDCEVVAGADVVLHALAADPSEAAAIRSFTRTGPSSSSHSGRARHPAMRDSFPRRPGAVSGHRPRARTRRARELNQEAAPETGSQQA